MPQRVPHTRKARKMQSQSARRRFCGDASGSVRKSTKKENFCRLSVSQAAATAYCIFFRINSI